jgi:parallel beta-helix repeat protein
VPVRSQQGGRLTLAAATTYDIPKGYGYFLQNHPAALDRDGEWFYDSASRSITVLLPDSTPAAHRFAVSVTTALLTVTRGQGIEIRDLRLEGANRANLEISQASRVTVAGIESVRAGDIGLRCTGCRDLTVEDNLIDGALNHGLDVYNCTACAVRRNRILNTATIAGMERSGNSQYNGVRFGGADAVFEENTVRRTGYLGVDVRGGARIVHNDVSEFNLVKTDGGGIYTWGNRDVDVIGNYVHDGVGSKSAVPWNSPATHGIYIDDQCENVTVEGNTVTRIASLGVYLHNTRDVRVERNTVVGAGDAQIGFVDDNLGGYEVTNTSVRGNLFVATAPGALLARANTSGGAGFFTNIGTMAANRYCAPFGEPVFSSSATGVLFLGQWQRLVATDGDAQLCPQRYPASVVKSVAGADRVRNGRFDRDLSGTPTTATSARS